MLWEQVDAHMPSKTSANLLYLIQEQAQSKIMDLDLKHKIENLGGKEKRFSAQSSAANS